MPATYAKIFLVTGDQGMGKSTVGTGFAVTAYHSKMTGLRTPEGKLIRAISVDRSVNREDYDMLTGLGIAPNVLKYARIFSDDNKRSKLIRIPPNWIVESPVHIFANYHLYGVRYKLIDLAFVIEHMNTDLFYEAWMLLDEGPMNARRSMEGMGKLGGDFAASIRKRNANFVAMTQYNRMIEVLVRLFATTRIGCTMDEDTKMITCEGTRRGEPLYFEVHAPDYWPYFDTEEIIQVPQERIDRALAQVYKTGALVG